MGYGTTWQLGQESEVRLLWEEWWPARHLAIDVKFITSLELQILRWRLHGLPAFDPKIEVYEPAFPRPSDPEFEEWYQNIEQEFNRAIDRVLPDWLRELRTIKPAEVVPLGAEWGAATEGWWHKQWPDHAAWASSEFIRVASAADKERMNVFAKEYL